MMNASSVDGNSSGLTSNIIRRQKLELWIFVKLFNYVRKKRVF
jgi:hypothetical protein